MKTREIKIATANEALERIKAYLFANMMDANDLEMDDPKAEHPNIYIKLVWLSRDADDKNVVGCPCFVCSFHGNLPAGNKPIDGIVYAKVFADKDINMVKMHMIEEDSEEGVNYTVTPIEEGETFPMTDDDKRFEDETFIYKAGKIEKIA